MANTFSERLELAMKGGDGYPKVSQTALAKGLELTQQAVSLWLKGDTKGMHMAYLYPVAGRLGVRAEWLATGTGPMREVKPDLQLSKLSPVAVAETLSWCTYLQDVAGELPYSELSRFFIATHEKLVADGGTASPQTASSLVNQATELAALRGDNNGRSDSTAPSRGRARRGR
jgi:transcriptional regulator with XRE-family HTH domain